MSKLTSAPQPPRTAREALDERIVRSLAEGNSATTTAALVGRSVATIYRKLRDPLFASKVADAKAERLKPLADTAIDAARPALAKLVELANDESVHVSSRIRSLVHIIDLAVKLDEHLAVLPRLAAAEAAIQKIVMARYYATRPNPAMQAAEDVAFLAIEAEAAEPETPES